MLAAEGGALAFERRAGERRLAVAINAGDSPTSLALGPAGTDAKVLLSTGRARMTPPGLNATEGSLTIQLPRRSAAVVALG
jgi:hypothetical protein